MTAVLNHPSTVDPVPTARVVLLGQALVVLADEDREVTADYAQACRTLAAREWFGELAAARAQLRTLERHVRDQLAALGAECAGGEYPVTLLARPPAITSTGHPPTPVTIPDPPARAG
ncbi:MAG TPA: hypothetical protein VFX16_08430 [Pseudonocardiaceae bacterium]|nr:hypothetical protein [Pseudonocardiaceae bacterium]